MKRIVSIQDISCFGKCSLTVALPICSAMGIETCVLPTAVLSTHTGTGFEGYTYRDLTTDIPAIAAHWKRLGLHFDAICTGYLGSIDQVQMVADFIDTFKSADTAVIVDPVMGDRGAFYNGFDRRYASAMRTLCAKADYILPNATEAALLLDEAYTPAPTSLPDLQATLRRLATQGAHTVVMTGVAPDASHQGAMAYCRDTDTYHSAYSDNIPGYFHSTGDVFAAVFAGAIALGYGCHAAIQKAVDFTVDCIRHTLGHEREHWYSVCFEECLGSLTAAYLR